MQVLDKMTYCHWNAKNALFISTWFLFGLLVSENVDDKLLRELILQSVNFLELHDVLISRGSSQGIKIHSNMSS